MPTHQQDVLADIAIDRSDELPIGVQLAWALRARIGDGRLAPGERLPGLRELAETLGINANTARSVYQRLEQEGLIDSRQGTGTFVAGVADRPSATAGQIAADAARRARTTGIDPREVAAALYVTVPDSRSNHPQESATEESETREQRQELRAQIAALEQTLSEMQARHPSTITPPATAPPRAGPRLLSVEELEEVRGELVRRLAATEPLLQAVRAQQRDAARAHQAEITRTATANARSRKSAEERAARRQSAAKPAAKKPPSPRATRRPGPSTA